MRIAILAELVVVGAAEAVGTSFLGRSIREWKLDAFFSDLSPAAQRAFLEVAAAAVLEDGKLSDKETEWLERRRAGSKDRDVVDAALATATSVLPPRNDPDQLRAFLAERASALPDEVAREKTFFTAAVLLARSGSADHIATARLFGEALGVSEPKLVETAGLIAGGAAL